MDFHDEHAASPVCSIRVSSSQGERHWCCHQSEDLGCSLLCLLVEPSTCGAGGHLHPSAAELVCTQLLGVVTSWWMDRLSMSFSRGKDKLLLPLLHPEHFFPQHCCGSVSVWQCEQALHKT